MEFKKLQKEILYNAKMYEENFKIKIDEDFSVLKLAEEMGEFYQALLIHRKKCRPEKSLPTNESKQALAHELADIFGMVIVIADRLNIDLEEALNKKWLDHLPSK
ncbi:MAG: MazG nucleotide pyrophosphohydrolase domain-containing protein [Candidatus Binatia bacterium]|nr:MazG nucleotide pyrophosphohydrolase domain-containing protein [bacterium]MDZ4342259.1 MazG nucleotide pyrophosphohydrolase domain-containing protein [Candidatus Binatia bacterium]